MLQVDQPLIDALHGRGFSIAIETNGTIAVPDGIDWICVSPKAGTELVQTCGDELKLVYPQAGLDPADLLPLDFEHRFLQPMDGPDQARNTRAAIDYCKANPPWRLSVQTHKVLGIP
jgi:organic radical activating enzyme